MSGFKEFSAHSQAKEKSRTTTIMALDSLDCLVLTPSQSCLAQAGRTSVHCVLSPDSRGRALCVNISTTREVVDRRRSGAPNGLHRHWHCAQKASLGASEQRDNPTIELCRAGRDQTFALKCTKDAVHKHFTPQAPSTTSESIGKARVSAGSTGFSTRGDGALVLTVYWYFRNCVDTLTEKTDTSVYITRY